MGATDAAENRKGSLREGMGVPRCCPQAPRPQRAARGPCKPRRPGQALLSPASLAAGITRYQRDCLCRCASRKVQSGLLARGTAVWAAPRGPEPQQSVAGWRPDLRRRRGGGGPGAALGHLPSPNMSPSGPTRPAALPSSPGAVSLRSTLPAEPGIQPGSRARAQGLRGLQAPRTAALNCRPPPSCWQLEGQPPTKPDGPQHKG